MNEEYWQGLIKDLNLKINNLEFERNMKQDEIDRLNNIINELEEYKYAVYKIKQYINSYNPYFIDTQEDNNKKIANIINEIGKKKLKDSD